MSKVCTSCGASINENAKFCLKCGTKQEIAVIPAPEETITNNFDESDDFDTSNDVDDFDTSNDFDDFDTSNDFDDFDDSNSGDFGFDDTSGDYEFDEIQHPMDTLSNTDLDQEINRAEQLNIEGSDTSNDVAVKPVSRAVRRRRIIDDDPEENDNAAPDKNAQGLMALHGDGGKYADEKADEQKHVEVEEEEVIEEGRKHVTNQKREHRRRERQQFDESKHYKIEQEASDDDNYDGYYENVLPIDHAEEKKGKMDPKVIATVIGLCLFVGIAIAFIGIVISKA